MSIPLTKDTVFDGFFAFDAGVNTGIRPSILPPNQLAHAVNTTVRGGFCMPRPTYRKKEITFPDTVVQSLFEDGRFQGAAYYQPDSGKESLMAQIGGHTFQIRVTNDTFNLLNMTVSHTTSTTVDFVVPAIGATVVVIVSSTVNINAGVPILIDDVNFFVQSIDSAVQMTVINVDGTAGDTISANSIVTYYDVNPATKTQAWMWQAEKWMIINDGESVPIFFDGAGSRRSLGSVAIPPELTTGTFGAYWRGRNWWVNPDGKTFRASDVVYFTSGTAPEKLRDSVLKQSDNVYLTTGSFSIPSNAGDITAMRFVNLLDASLGHGALQVSTSDLIFSCDASPDSADWQDVTSPILTVSQISYGAQGQNSTILVNGDMLYRSTDGMRSLVLGRREVVNWGNTPISNEVTRYTKNDDPSLLRYGSAILFDNRVLMTVNPIFSQHGIYHRGVAVLNTDTLSTMNEKKPSVWEGMWTGMNVLQLVKGRFAGHERAFAFVLNLGTLKIELYEIEQSAATEVQDNNGNNIPIRWSFETPDLFRKTGINECTRVRLLDGELYLSDVIGNVTIRVRWKPDQHPCWVLWKEISVCSKQSECSLDENECLKFEEYKPQYRPRQGLGEPPMDCDTITNKPLREGYTFAVRIEVQGHCRVHGLRLAAVPTREPVFAPVTCDV